MDQSLTEFLYLAPDHQNLVRYWEIIADNPKKRSWSWGYVLAIDSQGRTIFVVDAHGGDGKAFCCASG
jgi:hypothetical protein